MARTLGLDFGTTNTVMAEHGPDGTVSAISFRHGNDTFSAFRSVLCFWRELAAGGLENRHEAGPWAIDRFIDAPLDSRFLQSFKTFAASHAFRHTTVGGTNYAFEDLLAGFFGKFRAHAGTALETLPHRIVLGRPVTFAGGNPDAALARERYETAFRRFGFSEIHHVYEPVAAAFYFAQRLTNDATVLVADLGGGTSDFSVIRFTVGKSGVSATPLAQSGVAVAGDTFDYRIIDNVVSPRLGKATQIKSWGKVLDFPNHYFTNFARWNQLSIMKSGKVLGELRALARESLARDKIEAFITFIDADVGHQLYRAVSEAKLRLSSAGKAALRFSAGGLSLDETISRLDFNRWIADDLDRLDGAVSTALKSAGLDEVGIDKVFLTGGTSFVPAVQQLFALRFGRAKIETGEQLLSIAYGLALIGKEPDIERWSVA